jgi:hypothetical protein
LTADGNREGETMTEPNAIREVVAAFDGREGLENAIEDLQSHGFDRSQLSLLASRSTVEDALHRPLDDTHALEADPETPRSEPLAKTDVGNVVGVTVGAPAAFAALTAAGAAAALTGGVAGIAIAALAAGGGVGALGGFLAKKYDDHIAADLQTQVEHGGILLWVSVRDPGQEADARRVLARHARGEVHAHDIAAPEQPDPTSAPGRG